jgi:homoserine dehydrogenase
MKNISIGLIGFGTIGTGVVKVLQKNAVLIRQRLGISLVLKRIADLDIASARSVVVSKNLLTTDALQVIDDPEIDIIVELMGGIQPAKQFILRALKNGKHVVTANKALLAECGAEIFRTAAAHGVDVAFEGSVGGGIPVIRAVREGFAANHLLGIFGILNGTSNYILSRMTEQNESFEKVLQDAKQQGFAEADPTLDIEGIDAAHKLAVLINLAYGRNIKLSSIYTEGISEITPLDIEFARELGYKIKLLAICRGNEEEIDARVHPTLIPEGHLLSQVSGTFNAIFLQGDAVGPCMLYGKGAGMMPTASAVVSDIMDLARNIQKGISQRLLPAAAGTVAHREIRVKGIKNIQTRYYLRFSAVDKPGVLAKIAGILGRNQISIHSVMQRGRRVRGGAVPIFMFTHEARESNLQKALRQMNRLSILRGKTMCIRIEDGFLQGE